MIEGNGDIASVLAPVDRQDRLFFARGVSNSREARSSMFDREGFYLLNQPRDKRLIYFGSLSIFYGDTPYTRHKREMERLVRGQFPQYTIVRLGNITWGTNPNTLINTFRRQIEAGEQLEMRDEYRYIVDQLEFMHWMSMIPDFNCEMNIPGRRMKVADIAKEIQEGKL